MPDANQVNDDPIQADDHVNDDDVMEDQSQDTNDDRQAGDDDADASQRAEREILDRLAKEGGIDLRSKYRTDADFIKGFKELQTKLHQRDQDAALGRVFREHEEEFRAYLNQARAQASNQQQASQRQQIQGSRDGEDGAGVVNIDDYYVLQARVIDPKTGAVREDASPDDVKRFKSLHNRLEKNIIALGLKTKDAIADAVKEILAEREKQWQEQAAQHQAKAADMQAVDQFLAEAASWMYVDGKSPDSGYRPEGERFWQIADSIYEQDRAAGRIRPYAEIMELAEAKLIKEQAMKTATQTPSQRIAGRRKPNTPSKADSVTARLEELISKDYSMTDALNQLVKEGYNLEDLQ